ncbi:hypothetical protein K504DRAFT_466396 [Pleomassaria siparia CBS 279.74]|uniref:Uncharacterized protein n=1 Tax=Pleomassaria siparia CBS 279.74 TaxID=1314801 RepID=A0A6G1KC61_9PLEO|nr:hypothetical protein K504DRAFT_466396 [Pleomassaria siparia CBS 279.74]
MPPWVSRQCHALRVSRSAGSALCRPQRHATPVCIAAVRSYAKKSAPTLATAKPITTINCATIIPSSVSVSPDELIRHIRPIHESSEVIHKRHVHKHRFALFLLTPAFATWLLDDRTFLNKAVARLFDSIPKTTPSTSLKDVHVLCAVVDKLPTPQPVGTTEDAVLRRIQNTLTRDLGHEGLAYATLRFADSLLLPHVATDEAGSISFLTSKAPNDNDAYTETLRLPLANTVFQTGSPHTMIMTKWHRGKTGSLVLHSKQNITHHGIVLFQKDSHVQSISALTIPLIPLCYPRLVMASMGNILRQIAGPQNEAVPASQNLERLVPKYLESRGESSQTLPVWALVIPKKALNSANLSTRKLLRLVREENRTDGSSSSFDSFKALWRSDPSKFNNLVMKSIEKGSRLHRVLSGGGGWGKKAGLLSLDPAISSTETESSISQKFSEELDGPGDLSSALHPVVHPEDSIQFFVSPSVQQVDGDIPGSTSSKLRELTEMSAPWKFEFGTIPSTIDALQSNSWQHNDSPASQVFVFPHSFGALAEGGMALRRNIGLAATSLDSVSVVGGTKIDVPFSRFCSVDLKKRRSVGLDEGVCGPVPIRIRKYKHGNEHDIKRSSFDAAPASWVADAVNSTESAMITEDELEPEPEPEPEPKPRVKSKVLTIDSRVERIREIDVGPNLETDAPYPPLVEVAKSMQLGLGSKPMEKAELKIGPFTTVSPDKKKDRQRELKHVVRRILPKVQSFVYGSDPDTSCLNETLDSRIQSIGAGFDADSKNAHVIRKFDAHPLSNNYVVRKVSHPPLSLRNDNDAQHSDLPPVHLLTKIVTQLRQQANLTERCVYALQKELEELLSEISRNPLQAFERELERIQNNIHHLAEIAWILDVISARTHFTQQTNISAITIYHLHISLRWTLSSMIDYRQYHEYPESCINPLQDKLEQLRSFQEVLFVERKDVTESDVRKRLDEWEGLKLWRAGDIPRERVTQLSSRQRMEMARKLSLKQIHKSTYIGPMLRKTEDRSDFIRKFVSGRVEVPGYEVSYRSLERRWPAAIQPRHILNEVKSPTDVKRAEKRKLAETVSSWLDLPGGDGDEDGDGDKDEEADGDGDRDEEADGKPVTHNQLYDKGEWGEWEYVQQSGQDG